MFEHFLLRASSALIALRLRSLSKAWHTWSLHTVMLADHQHITTRQLHDALKYLNHVAQAQQQRRVRGAWHTWTLRDVDLAHKAEMHVLVQRQHVIALTALERLFVRIHRQLLWRGWVAWRRETQHAIHTEAAQAQYRSRSAGALHRIVHAARRRGLRNCLLRWRITTHEADNEMLASVRACVFVVDDDTIMILSLFCW